MVSHEIASTLWGGR